MIVAAGMLSAAAGAAEPVRPDAARPNIVWLVSEDHGPHVGCYGDRFATTPNIDRLAARGLRYRYAWSCAPVCAPARTALISGLYPPSTGGEHMRSMVAYPGGRQMFPQLLRAAGYYCTNNAKEDYNLTQPGQVWDESSARAHWRHRQPGQPFFAVFNSTRSHESQIRTRPHAAVHDPANVRIPAYHPDTPEVRQDWAQYYDGVSAADADAGKRLGELAEAGLLEKTIVFYYSDHGSGMPRNKRWLYSSGLHVPLVVSIPEKFRALRPEGYVAGGTSDRLVSFVDFAPTVLSLAGVQPPSWLQGQAFLGPYAGAPSRYVYSFRGRMDEKIDLSRGVTDGRYVYIRNYLPHRPQGQYLAYMFETPSTRIWRQLHDAQRLTPAQESFWSAKPSEELYDLHRDPDQIHNLAGERDAQETLQRLRAAQQTWCRSMRDLGFLPEGEMHRRAAGSSPYDMGRDEAAYPFERVFQAAERAAGFDPESIAALVADLGDGDPAVRYWGAMGLLIRGAAAVASHEVELVRALDDASPYVGIAAAEALGRHRGAALREQAVARLVTWADCRQHDVFVAISALNALSVLELPEGTRQAVRQLPTTGQVPHPRYAEYVGRLLKE